MNNQSLLAAAGVTATLVGAAAFVHLNPVLFGRRIPNDDDDKKITIIKAHPMLDAVLEAHKSELGEDYVAYRNHCLRVLTLAVHYYLPTKEQVENKINVMAVALAYHDIALWTDKKLDYLDPSVALMEREAEKFGFLKTAKDKETAKEIILQHHKYTDYNSSSDDVDADMVNAVRKADWADASYGVVRFDSLPSGTLQQVYDALPESGFHNVLAGLGPRLSPDSLAGQMEILKIMKW